MFHAQQIEFQNTVHGLLPSADRDPRMRQIPLPEFSVSPASDFMSDVSYLDQQRHDRQKRVAELHALNTIVVEFDNSLAGLMQRKHFEVGCEPGNGFAQVDYSTVSSTNEDGDFHRVEMHWDNDSPARLQTKGAERIIARDELYPKRDDETRLKRVTAYLLMQDGLGHVEKFPTGTRHNYDAYVTYLEAQGVDYIKFTDGFQPCVMTATQADTLDALPSQEVDTLPMDSGETIEMPTRKVA